MFFMQMCTSLYLESGLTWKVFWSLASLILIHDSNINSVLYQLPFLKNTLRLLNSVAFVQTVNSETDNSWRSLMNHIISMLNCLVRVLSISVQKPPPKCLFDIFSWHPRFTLYPTVCAVQIWLHHSESSVLRFAASTSHLILLSCLCMNGKRYQVKKKIYLV